MGRTRTLSDHGKYLLNISYQPDPKSSLCLKTIKKHLYNMFHTDYDDKVEEAVKQFQKGSEKLYSLFGENKNTKEIANLINNAITQIVILILTDDNKAAKYMKARYNYDYYLNIIRECIKVGDHNTAIIVWIAITHLAIDRLKFKKRKRENKLFEQLLELYGKVEYNCLKHIEDFALKHNKKDEIPSIMMLLINLKKTQEYHKHLKNTFAGNQAEIKIKSINNLLNLKCDEYKNKQENIRLYTESFKENIYFKTHGYKTKYIDLKLIELSKNIKSK